MKSPNNVKNASLINISVRILINVSLVITPWLETVKITLKSVGKALITIIVSLSQLKNIV